MEDGSVRQRKRRNDYNAKEKRGVYLEGDIYEGLGFIIGLMSWLK